MMVINLGKQASILYKYVTLPYFAWQLNCAPKLCRGNSAYRILLFKMMKFLKSLLFYPLLWLRPLVLKVGEIVSGLSMLLVVGGILGFIRSRAASILGNSISRSCNKFYIIPSNAFLRCIAIKVKPY